MRVTIVRPMPNFSMDVYADSIIAGLKAVRPSWQISELRPVPVDRGSRSIFIRAYKAYERFWSFPRKVQDQLKQSDIVHIIDHSEGHIVRWLRPKIGVQSSDVVVTCHDLINYFYRDNLQGSVRLPFLSDSLWMASVKSMRQATHVVTVSSETAKDVSRLLDIAPSKITVVPNAVENVFRPLSASEIAVIRKNLGAKEKTFCLLNIGSAHPRKNIDAILKVLAVLREKGLPVKLWKAGSDFTTAQRDWIENQLLSEYVEYLGNPDKPSLIKLYNAADVLLAPSFHEGFGLTLLESLACGTPVITSNVSAMPEVVGDAGILVFPDDIESMCEAVMRLYTDAAYRQSLVDKGLKRVKIFTWENASERIAQVYETLHPQRLP